VCFFLLATQNACKDAATRNTDRDTTIIAVQTSPEDFIKDFYAGYISANLKMPVDYKQVDALVDLSCSQSLIAYLDTAELEYDPFFNAQDVFDAWLSHIKVEVHATMPLCYWVYLDDPENSNASVIVLVRLKKYGSDWKIDQIVE
ncbi:MAG: DUF3828 domain-containing protein, partial [Chitinophagaceae bacterium]